MVYYTGIRKSSVAYTVSLWEKKLINIEVRRLEGETQKKLRPWKRTVWRLTGESLEIYTQTFLLCVVKAGGGGND